jgi:alkylhydroperoxidase family enzyme
VSAATKGTTAPGPRLPYAEVTAEEAERRKREGRRSAPNLQLAIAHAPEVAQNQAALLWSILDGLDPRLAELVILQQGLLNENAYCWGHHVPVAEDLGYTSEQIRALRDGNLTMLDDDDRQVIEYVNAVMARSVTDEQFAAMRERFGDQRLVKVTLLAGVYTMIGMAQSAMNVPQDEGFGGFECP